jgi:PAS domain S-box-containing protein
LKSNVTPDEVHKQLWETISSGRIWRGELCNRKKDGNLYWEWVSISPITNTEGEITHYVGIKEDITKRKKTLTALKESEEKHRILFMNSPDAYFIIIDGIITNCNYATEVMLRGDRAQIIGNSAELFIPQFQPDGRKSSEVLSEHINKALAYGIYTFECTNIRLDKTSFFAEVSMAPINIDGKQALFTTLRDITRRKQAEEALHESKQYLQKLNAEKDKFLSIIAHDLRSPFAGILGLMELLTEKLPNLTMDKIQEYISLVHDSAINIHRLLENLLDWAKVQRVLIPFTLELLPLQSVAEKSITSIREIAQQKGIEINTEIPEQLNVLADSNMLQTIIRNLTSNAIKYTRKGGKVTLSAIANADNDVEISIKDTGIGMNNTTINNLFRLDIKTNLPGTEGEPSSGLGLILCKEFIERHGGQIWIESKEGKGSTFFFTIPSNKM